MEKEEQMKIVIIDYESGNIQSIQFALNRLGFQAVLSNDPYEIEAADRVIFPGVGEAGQAMRQLQRTGLDVLIPQLKQPVLGICLGMQLLCNSTQESDVKGLGIFEVDVIQFSTDLKVPQVGWNTIYKLQSNVFDGIAEQEYMYSVHSYYAPICAQAIAFTTYGIEYASALQKDNFYGVQFHIEKSGIAGEKILANFLK